ncbi:MAG: AAA family ATPase, partial [Deltaproteobacteria bacterium]|nr:AAA family ATPase [Deltaproteobacteria bacterium]
MAGVPDAGRVVRMTRQNVVFGFLGWVLDQPDEPWRPTLALLRQRRLPVHRLELLFTSKQRALAEQVAGEAQRAAPGIALQLHPLPLADGWDFEEVYTALYDLASSYPLDTERCSYYLHLTTGTHVQQICWFLLAEARILPARLLQSYPCKGPGEEELGLHVVDLQLPRYEKLLSRFDRRRADGLELLRSGIATRNAAFNRLLAQLEQVALASPAPLLFLGSTGTGKSLLARRTYELLARSHRLAKNRFVEVSCATLSGQLLQSTLFGHVRGAFTGAVASRRGLLQEADGGVLFLDEIGELGGEEQAMLLHALETRRFRPLGADAELSSDFRLLAATQRDLFALASRGHFRSDLLARLSSWVFELPPLCERPEDIEPNIAFELARFEQQHGRRVRFHPRALEELLCFATSPAAPWLHNFRDLGQAVARLATLAGDGLIGVALVREEIVRLQERWRRLADGGSAPGQVRPDPPATVADPAAALPAGLGPLDRFDAVQLAEVLRVLRAEGSLSAAGRRLFACSRSY